MKFMLGALVILAFVALVHCTCNIGFGKRERNDLELISLQARSGPVQTPQNLTLFFDYETDPTRNEEITLYHVYGSVSNCSFRLSPSNSRRAFRVELTTVQPVVELHGNVTVYGFRWG
ncbi:uncharacterized protein LOC129769129 [Toxorhynchites rutilus septentrionalis]|uniref:uncharacterized protein LOC129769129 n=1 Tax=Toxorhynchites rutilus septentrionalis TaxID=329112 RepID=UPI0024793BA3|nr:uncharacterized protein LOC129769129 [Toxorhynchites rutilus septentrionalis]